MKCNCIQTIHRAHGFFLTNSTWIGPPLISINLLFIHSFTHSLTHWSLHSRFTLNLLCWMALPMYLRGFSRNVKYGCGSSSISKTPAKSKFRNVASNCVTGLRSIVTKAVRGCIISSMTSLLKRAWLQRMLGRVPSSSMMSRYFQWNLEGQ